VLADYLRRQAALPFALGKTDCVTLIADWVQERRGVDPIAHCRGGYSDWTEADALRSGWGGLVRVAGKAARQVGMRMTREPRTGDVAVVSVGNVIACAIRGHHRWAMRFEGSGLVFLSADRVRVIAAWSL
jgi:hypothetical protein